MHTYDELKNKLTILDESIVSSLRNILKEEPNKVITLNKTFDTYIDGDFEQIKHISLLGNNIILLESLGTETYSFEELNTYQKFELFRQVSLQIELLTWDELTKLLPPCVKLCNIEVLEMLDTLQNTLEYKNNTLLSNNLEHTLRQKGGDCIEDLLDGLRQTMEEKNIPTSNMEDIVDNIIDYIIDELDVSIDHFYKNIVFVHLNDGETYQVSIKDLEEKMIYDNHFDFVNCKVFDKPQGNTKYKTYQ